MKNNIIIRNSIIRLIGFSPLITGIWVIINSFNQAYAFEKNIKHSPNNGKFELPCNSSIYLAQSGGLSGCWVLKHSASGTIYESMLRMNGYDGVMVTRFFDSRIGDTIYVKQTMKLENSSNGLVIYGYNPINANTGASLLTYSPDNFLYQIRPNGEQLFGTCDDQGQCSSVQVTGCPPN